MSWRQVNIQTKYHDTDKPVYSRASKYYSTQKIMNWMQGCFGTVQAARQSQEAHQKWVAGKADKTPESERWGEFVSVVRRMERTYEGLGIQLARVEKVDFSDVGKPIVYSNERGWHTDDAGQKKDRHQWHWERDDGRDR